MNWVRFAPLRSATGMAVRSASPPKILIQIVQRQILLVSDMQLVYCQLAGNHQCHLREFHRKRVDVHAEELAGVDVDEPRLFVGKLGAEAFADQRFQALHFAVGEVEEVAAAAGGVEDAEGG